MTKHFSVKNQTIYPFLSISVSLETLTDIKAFVSMLG